MFIWDFVADTILGQIVDWIYGQVMGFLGNFFAEMGNMGVELFELSWVQSIVLFFSYLAWALYVTGLVVACFECGIEYSSGRGNLKETALCAIKGFMAVSLFTVVPIRLYELSVTLQASLTAGITGYGTSIGEAATEIVNSLSGIDSLTGMTTGSYFGFASITSPIMLLFCIILMAYAVIKVFFANLKRGGILANALCDKLIYRHPHVYGDIHANTPDEVKENWEALKLRKKNRKSGTLGGVPRSLPALVKAFRVGEKAAGAGFDWQRKEDVWAKVKEEIAEVEAEMRAGRREELEGEFGDLFFALVNAARLYGVDPESALARTNEKFIRRFNYMEEKAASEGHTLHEMTLDEMEALWQRAKREE